MVKSSREGCLRSSMIIQGQELTTATPRGR
ncbi:hypothetical protein Golob_023155, partial [Gossypium lobatum]|nr:hypothetical protein [Gossypium lobatum]